jgi:hypothetical protein
MVSCLPSLAVHRYERRTFPGQDHGKSGAFPLFGFDRNLPIVRLHQGFYDGEPQPGAALSAVGLAEPLEYEGKKSRRDADSLCLATCIRNSSSV